MSSSPTFLLPDLIVESVIRDGLAVLFNNPDQIDRIFSSLKYTYNQRKYGTTELDRIKNLILKEEINVVHSFNEVQASLPCFSIQLGTDVEDQRLAHLDDFQADVRETMTDPDELANLIRLDNIVPIAYDEKSGQLSLVDETDLVNIYPNLILVDAAGNEFKILPGMSNTTGNKFITIEKHQTPDLTDFLLIKSSINFKQFEVRSVVSNVNLMIGVHSKNTLTTKYLYILLKYFMLKHKQTLIKRGLMVATYQGSDFTKNMEYHGDMVYNRFLNISGKIQESWAGDDGEIIDNVQLQVYIPKDRASAEELGVETQTIKPID